MNMIKDFAKLRCLINLKLHFLYLHLDHIANNLGFFSGEQERRFCQDLKEMERHPYWIRHFELCEIDFRIVISEPKTPLYKVPKN